LLYRVFLALQWIWQSRVVTTYFLQYLEGFSPISDANAVCEEVDEQNLGILDAFIGRRE